MTTFHHHYFAQSLDRICVTQSHYIKVQQGAIFMEQNMYETWANFGLLPALKKKMGSLGKKYFQKSF